MPKDFFLLKNNNENRNGLYLLVPQCRASIRIADRKYKSCPNEWQLIVKNVNKTSKQLCSKIPIITRKRNVLLNVFTHDVYKDQLGML